MGAFGSRRAHVVHCLPIVLSQTVCRGSRLLLSAIVNVAILSSLLALLLPRGNRYLYLSQ